MHCRSFAYIASSILFLSSTALAQQETAPPTPEVTPEVAPEKKKSDKGLQIESGDGRFAINIGARLQFRYSYEGMQLPEEEGGRLSSFRIRRARLKVGGHGFEPWFKYYFEYDFPSTTMLDWRVSIERFKAVRLRFGQWKVNYNRERVDSSGKQQMVDRSIVNSFFTLDRQVGLELYGSFFEDSNAYFEYSAGAFTGTGLNETSNDDDNLLWLGRLQWNFLGRKVDHYQSDVKYSAEPVAAIGASIASNRTDRIKFPERSDLGEPGQYRIEQIGQDFVFRYKGLSVQQEFHTKAIRDRVEQTVTNSRGGYLQAGVMPHAIVSAIPRPLELAARYAMVDPDVTRPDDLQRELTVGANWYFEGHDNKLTADFTRLTDPVGGNEDMVRLQWDVSF